MGTFAKLAFCLVLAAASLGCRGETGNQDRTVVGETLDPEVYRAEIQALENDVYQPAFDANVRSTVAIKLDDLAGKVAQEDGALTMLFCVEMRQLAQAVQLGRDAGYIRENWERIRCGLFEDAVWYRWRNSPTRPQAASHAQLPGDGQMKRDYEYVLRKLDELVERGKRDVERMGEPEEISTSYYRGDYKYLVEEWEDWADDWRAKLDRLEDDLPDQPSYQESAALRMAHGNLEKSMQWLNAVPVGRGQWSTPFRSHWEKCFRHAEDELDRARFQIEK